MQWEAARYSLIDLLVTCCSTCLHIQSSIGDTQSVAVGIAGPMRPYPILLEGSLYMGSPLAVAYMQAKAHQAAGSSHLRVYSKELSRVVSSQSDIVLAHSKHQLAA